VHSFLEFRTEIDPDYVFEVVEVIQVHHAPLQVVDVGIDRRVGLFFVGRGKDTAKQTERDPIPSVLEHPGGDLEAFALVFGHGEGLMKVGLHLVPARFAQDGAGFDDHGIRAERHAATATVVFDSMRAKRFFECPPQLSRLEVFHQHQVGAGFV